MDCQLKQQKIFFLKKNFIEFCRSLKLHQSLLYVTLQKPIVHRGVEYGLKVPVGYRFQWRKTTAGWLQRLTWKKRYTLRLKSIALLQNCKMKSKIFIVILNSKKCCLLGKTTKMSDLILLFSETPKIFICVRVRQMAFLS